MAEAVAAAASLDLPLAVPPSLHVADEVAGVDVDEEGLRAVHWRCVILSKTIQTRVATVQGPPSKKIGLLIRLSVR